MLLKFTSPDMLNSTLVDVNTGKCAYNIVTILVSTTVLPEEQIRSSDTSSNPRSPTMVGSSPSFLKKRAPSSSSEILPDVVERRTSITAPTGKVLAEIAWQGCRPTISIHGEKVGGLTDLFGSTTVRFMPKNLVIPTRFDTEYVWMATTNSLTLFDCDTDSVKGSFYRNVFRLPTVKKGAKHRFLSKKKSSISLRNGTFFPDLPSPSQTEDTQSEEEIQKSSFISTRIPGLGSSYIEFTPHLLAHDVEIILSFLMMEILRRGRFGLALYTFEKPQAWQFREAHRLLMRRVRRDTL
ncbi:hypothetical protein JR316_0003384 [Psilocybe cubensis]|uniref:Uncharacterized protein n=2 Tax=Psilocybe cubensis TaxID=181762 RepID=A0ACB8H7M0_PSICU|nr:hypothetical protein JR316_0003384 [Psilocybe cubensis]KAH9483906.1 hypothetical protein JR316_0003384 [Psilocybe cubensis]